jgi:hypothetical protein
MDEEENLIEIEIDDWTITASDEIGEYIVSAVNRFDGTMRSMGNHDKWMKQWRVYTFGTNDNSGSIVPGLVPDGAGGQFLHLNINQVRSIIQSILGMIMNNDLEFDVMSNNTDVSSAQLVSICKNLIDYYMKHDRISLHEKLYRAVEHAYVFDAGYILQEWDPNAFAHQQKSSIPDGEINVSTPTPFDVVFDTDIDVWEDHDWVIVKQFVKRSTLVKRFPEF